MPHALKMSKSPKVVNSHHYLGVNFYSRQLYLALYTWGQHQAEGDLKDMRQKLLFYSFAQGTLGLSFHFNLNHTFTLFSPTYKKLKGGSSRYPMKQFILSGWQITRSCFMLPTMFLFSLRSLVL